jgi:hypothetical protein
MFAAGRWRPPARPSVFQAQWGLVLLSALAIIGALAAFAWALLG